MYCTAPKPAALLLDPDNNPIFNGGKLLPAGAASVFSSYCASAMFGPVATFALPPPPPLGRLVLNPDGINEPSALPTAFERFGTVGCGITSAATSTVWLPAGWTPNGCD
jgi:hypothetical protein